MISILLCIPPNTPSIMFFFFNDTATTEIYTLSLHDALPISGTISRLELPAGEGIRVESGVVAGSADRKSTRLNSSHSQISYAVFCLKKKKEYMNYDTKRYQDIQFAGLDGHCSVLCAPLTAATTTSLNITRHCSHRSNP